VNLSQAVEQYILLKQSLGFRFRIQSYTLRAFSRAMGKLSVGQVKPATVRAFLDGHGPVTEAWSQKWSILRGFYAYAIARGMVRRSPLPLQAPKISQTFTPYIYSQQDLRKLLGAITPERTWSLSPQTMRTLLLLLYGAGLRLSEALNLEDAHVDLKERMLQVQRSKFFKSRLVPIGAKLAAVLADYAEGRPPIRGAHRCFLRTKTGCRLHASTVGKSFRAVREAAGVRRTDGSRYQPRLHDLRHSRATHCLLAWYREGADVQALLPQLSAYLGHAEVIDTQRYLTMTPELREQASERFVRYAWGGRRE
jgi:site-specific recombinase XerD